MRRIAVTGPALAGVSAVAAALSEALPDVGVVEWTARCRQRPDVVVFVVSAAAPMTESQAAILESVLAATGRVAVVAAVSKIDLHRAWADVLEVNRGMWAAGRVAIPWVGVAADPDLGERRIDDLVDAVRRCPVVCAARGAVPNRPPRRVGDRAEVILRRADLAQARLRVNGRIRTGCAELRTELQRQAGRCTRRGLAHFGERALAAANLALAEWDEAITAEFDAILAGVGAGAGVDPTEPIPPIAARAPEGADPTEVRLTVLIGSVFGLGVALTAGRLAAGLAAGWTSAGAAVVGLALALGVIHSRRLLSERAAMLRWVADVLTGARQMLEERAASRALAAEVALGLAHAAD